MTQEDFRCPIEPVKALFHLRREKTPSGPDTGTKKLILHPFSLNSAHFRCTEIFASWKNRHIMAPFGKRSQNCNIIRFPRLYTPGRYFLHRRVPSALLTSWSDDLSESGECRGAKRSGDTPIGLLFRREIQPRGSERGNGGSARDAAGSGFPDPSPESPADA